MLQPGYSTWPSTQSLHGDPWLMLESVLDHWEVPGHQPVLASSILGQSRAPKPEGGAPSLTRPCQPSQAAPAPIWVRSASPLAKSMRCPWEQEKQPQGPAAADRPGFLPAGRAILMRRQHGRPAPIRWCQEGLPGSPPPFSV